MAGVSGILLAVLAMAALLGVLVGVSATVLLRQRRERARQRAQAERDRQAAADKQDAIERLELSRQTLERERQVHKDALAGVKRRDRDLAARQEALQMHAHTQARRIETLLEEQTAAEERAARLERSLRAQREELADDGRPVHASGARGHRRDRTSGVVDRAAVSRRATAVPPASAPDDLPVLNRRVGAPDSASVPESSQAVARQGSRTASRPRSRLASGRLARAGGGANAVATVLDDAEFPVLSEEELPDSVDGLELDAALDD